MAQSGEKSATLSSTAGWTVGRVSDELECSAEEVFEKSVEGAHLAGFSLLLLIKCKRKETGDVSASKEHQDGQQPAEPRKKQARLPHLEPAERTWLCGHLAFGLWGRREIKFCCFKLEFGASLQQQG